MIKNHKIQTILWGKTWCDEIDMALQELADKTRLKGKPEAEGYRDYASRLWFDRPPPLLRR